MLSIIIITKNEEKYLPLLLESIKNQEFKDYEIIVADANSNDKTIEIAKKFACKITKGGLPAKGRNEGAKIAKGDLLLFLDADLILPKNFLKKALFQFKKRKLSVASFPILPEGKLIDKIFYQIYNFWSLISQRFLAHASQIILVKKEIHQKIGGFDEKIKIAEDHWYVRQAKKFGKFGFIKTKPLLTSARRFEKDGRLKTYLKYLLAGVYMFFWGPPKSNFFNYKFAHY
jgi:glycosyltransferase involved in cell wall biosynthesis